MNSLYDLPIRLLLPWNEKSYHPSSKNSSVWRQNRALQTVNSNGRILVILKYFPGEYALHLDVFPVWYRNILLCSLFSRSTSSFLFLKMNNSIFDIISGFFRLFNNAGENLYVSSKKLHNSQRKSHSHAP